MSETTLTAIRPEGLWQRQEVVSIVLYWTIHAGCGVALWTGVSGFDVALCLGLFWIRMFGITPGWS